MGYFLNKLKNNQIITAFDINIIDNDLWMKVYRQL